MIGGSLSVAGLATVLVLAIMIIQGLPPIQDLTLTAGNGSVTILDRYDRVVAQRGQRAQAQLARFAQTVLDHGGPHPDFVQGAVAGRRCADHPVQLLKVAADQVQIAENHVRRIIVEEFPPKRHDRMRSLYLPDEG